MRQTHERLELLEAGSCCGKGCDFCPYSPQHKEGSTKVHGHTAFDLDGTLAKKESPFNIDSVGEPIEKMMKVLRRHLDAGDKVKILTARAHGGKIDAVKDWLKDQGLPDLEITCEKDPSMAVLYDDRAVSVKSDKGEVKFAWDAVRKTASFRATRLPASVLQDETLAVYDALRAVVGVADPIHPKHQEKGVKGLLRTLTGAGKGPKTGLMQSKVLGHPVDTTARAAIVPDARLDMDQVGVPEKMARRVYAPFVMRRLVRQGMPPSRAALEVEDHSPLARKALLEEIDDRYVMYSRDPALHRFNIMGAKPVLVPGSSIRVSPLVVGPYGADFDGDAMNLHLPVSDEAKEEVKKKMLPSKNLFSLRDRSVHYKPSQEFVLGAFLATSPNKSLPKVRFGSEEEAIEAYERKDITLDTPIEIRP